MIKLFPGITENFLRPIFESEFTKGFILETYGAGNMPTEEWLLQLVSETIKRGVPIVNITQCTGGRVVMGAYETSEKLRRLGVISGEDITTEAAVTKLMYLLGENISPKSLRTIFETSLRGEMS